MHLVIISTWNLLWSLNKVGACNNTFWIWSTFQIQTYDIGLGREETAMMITLHDYERRPLAEPGVDIKVTHHLVKCFIMIAKVKRFCIYEYCI